MIRHRIHERGYERGNGREQTEPVEFATEDVFHGDSDDGFHNRNRWHLTSGHACYSVRQRAVVQRAVVEGGEAWTRLRNLPVLVLPAEETHRAGTCDGGGASLMLQFCVPRSLSIIAL